MVITEGVTIAFINYNLLKRLSLAFVRHTDTLNPRCVVFKVHKAFERELPTFIVRERANLTRLKPMMPVKVVLQRMLTCVVARAGAAWRRRGHADIGKAGIGVEVKNQQGCWNLSNLL